LAQILLIVLFRQCVYLPFSNPSNYTVFSAWRSIEFKVCFKASPEYINPDSAANHLF
jgi:hypothetical protein